MHQRVAREARITAVDTAGGVRCVPLVDGGIELQAGSAHSHPACDLAPQIAGRTVRTGRPSVTARNVLEIVLDRVHEVVADAHRVVGVLVLDAERIAAVEVHVEAGVAQHARLALFFGLAPHELLDVGVIDVEDDHLGGASGLATALDRAGRCVGATHEADRPTGRATSVEQFVAGPDLRQVDTRARTPFEDDALFAVPVEDAVIVSSTARMKQALACCGTPPTPMLNHTGLLNAALCDQDVLQFVTERLGLGLVGK